MEKSKVFFTKDVSPNGVLKVFNALSTDLEGKIGIKVHFGAEGNQNFIKPEMYKLLVEKFQADFVETNCLYVSNRRFTESHIALAKEHGFGIAPICILDDEGEKEIAVDTKHFKSIKVGKAMDNYDSFIVCSHFKGHGQAGFGGAMKNVCMGFGSIGGKHAMHVEEIPLVDGDKCVECGLCLEKCPASAISINPVIIDETKCVGCGSCIGFCPSRVFNVPWSSVSNSRFQEKMADFTKGVMDNYKMVYINVLANVSAQCDCLPMAPAPFIEDIGILSSLDIVAVDKACYDLVNEKHHCEDAFLQETKVSGKKQLEYAYKTGLGQLDYELVNLD